MSEFLAGRVFGLKLSLNATGFCVREGDRILHLDTLVCPTQIGDLSARRGFRAQRRTIRARRKRKGWVREQLAAVGIGQGPTPPKETPLSWRLAAVAGENIGAAKLHAALIHLFQRRGRPMVVPWANGSPSDDDKAEAEAANAVKAEMLARGASLPCELLEARRKEAGKAPSSPWGRGLRWPSDLIEKEFRAIVSAQATHFPALLEKADWILWGETRKVTKNGEDYHVWTNRTEHFGGKTLPCETRRPGLHPGALGLRWPKFQNRSPELCALHPHDEKGRPQHVVGRDKPAYAKAQFEQAILNFRVSSVKTGRTLNPIEQFPRFIETVKQVFNSKGKVTEKALRKCAADFANEFELIEGHTEITPQSGAGRSRFSSATLDELRDLIARGEALPNVAKRLMCEGEPPESAIRRLLESTKNPLVKHRLALLHRELVCLIKRFGAPDFVCVEADRELAMSEDARMELVRNQRKNTKERRELAEEVGDGFRLKKYRLAKEAGHECVFTGRRIGVSDLEDYSIVHIVPRSRIVCEEWHNLILCPSALVAEKSKGTPFEVFGTTSAWPQMLARMDSRFKKLSPRKYSIFIAPDSEAELERQGLAAGEGYFARLVRDYCAITFDWLTGDGRIPSDISKTFLFQSKASVSRIRSAWGLSGLLHPVNKDADDTGREKALLQIKGDYRYCALDAAITSAIHPRAALSSDAIIFDGMNGLWSVDPKTHRSLANNPLGFTRDKLEPLVSSVSVRHHVSKSMKQKGYNTTFYSERTWVDTTTKMQSGFVTRTAITSLTEKNLPDIHPAWFAQQVSDAWLDYKRRVGEKSVADRLAKTKGCLPSEFTETLCASHLLRRHTLMKRAAVPYSSPLAIMRPIRDVRLVCYSSPGALTRGPKGTPGAFLARDGFAAAEIYATADGKGFVAVRTSFFGKHDRPTPPKPVKGRALLTVRKGDLFNLPAATPPGKWRMTALAEKWATLVPAHLSHKPEVLSANGIPPQGWKPSWSAFAEMIGLKG